MNKRVEQLLKATAAVLLAVYLVTATGLADLPLPLARTALFLLGPVAIAGITVLASRSAPPEDFVLVQRTGYVLLVIAFALFTSMLVVQQTGFAFYESGKDRLTDAKETFRLVNAVQLGLDISFDIFYCLGIFFFSLGFLKPKGTGRLVGWVGIATSTGLLVLNIASFPDPPGEAGLIDLGPATIAWWVLLVWFVRKRGPAPQ